jgi:hypothetical protein
MKCINCSKSIAFFIISIAGLSDAYYPFLPAPNSPTLPSVPTAAPSTNRNLVAPPAPPSCFKYSSKKAKSENMMKRSKVSKTSKSLKTSKTGKTTKCLEDGEASNISKPKILDDDSVGVDDPVLLVDSEERQNDFDDATDERSANSYPDKKIDLDNEFAETLYEDPSGSYREAGAIYSEMNSSYDCYQLTSGTVALTIAAAIFLL